MLRRAIISSEIAMVALNLTGLIPGILYIICRSKADWTMIQASERPWLSRKRAFEIPAPEMECCVHMDSPVSVQSDRSPTLTNDPEKSPIFPTSYNQETLGQGNQGSACRSSHLTTTLHDRSPASIKSQLDASQQDQRESCAILLIPYSTPNLFYSPRFSQHNFLRRNYRDPRTPVCGSERLKTDKVT